MNELKEALDEFMAHQVTGSREAMTALHRLCQAADKAVEWQRVAVAALEEKRTDWRERQPK